MESKIYFFFAINGSLLYVVLESSINFRESVYHKQLSILCSTEKFDSFYWISSS